jgi:hypothetical protein
MRLPDACLRDDVSAFAPLREPFAPRCLLELPKEEPMSFLKRLFGGGAPAQDAEPAPARQVEHKGFTIIATPYKADGQYQTCGLVTREIDGVVKEHKFIRADRFPGLDDAADISIRKGIQLVDEQGDSIFGPA